MYVWKRTRSWTNSLVVSASWGMSCANIASHDQGPLLALRLLLPLTLVFSEYLLQILSGLCQCCVCTADVRGGIDCSIKDLKNKKKCWTSLGIYQLRCSKPIWKWIPSKVGSWIFSLYVLLVVALRLKRRCIQYKWNTNALRHWRLTLLYDSLCAQCT